MKVWDKDRSFHGANPSEPWLPKVWHNVPYVHRHHLKYMKQAQDTNKFQTKSFRWLRCKSSVQSAFKLSLKLPKCQPNFLILSIQVWKVCYQSNVSKYNLQWLAGTTSRERPFCLNFCIISTPAFHTPPVTLATWYWVRLQHLGGKQHTFPTLFSYCH